MLPADVAAMEERTHAEGQETCQQQQLWHLGSDTSFQSQRQEQIDEEDEKREEIGRERGWEA